MITTPCVIYSREYICELGPHVFPIEKYHRVATWLREKEEVGERAFILPRPASRDELERVHDPGYLDDFFNLRMTKRTAYSEIPLTQDIVNLSVLSTGGTLVATDVAVKQGFAFHIGGGWHHAFAGHAEGFCYLNDTAVAIGHLQKTRPGLRVAVVDLDVHQGNGTAGIFRREASVFTFSMHQENLYPIKQQSTWDVGLEERAGDEMYLKVLGESLTKIFKEFRPEVVFYLAGADTYEHDQLGSLGLTIEGLSHRDETVLERCKAEKVPVVILLAGGYAKKVEDTVRIHVNSALAMFKVFNVS